MKPPPFEYHEPRTINEALDLLARYGGEARPLAGGQSLVALMNFRLSAPSALIDLNRVAELSYIKEENGRLKFGAMTRQRQIEFSPLVAQKLPLMTEATAFIGHLPTRTRGTIGGSIAHADPSAEYPALVTALDGEMVIRGKSGERTVKPADFFQGFLTTAIQPGEILVEVTIPVTPPKSGWAFEEFARRHGDFAIVEVAAMVTLDGGGKCKAARLAASGVGATPVKLREVEEIIEKNGLGERALDEAASRASELVDPTTDLHASADYRRHLTRVLTKRALARAVARAQKGS
ncbi:MAG: FAD binding domain-containing protein [Candidatus Binataceae bacterium]